MALPIGGVWSLLKPTDVAGRLGVSRAWVYEAAKDGSRRTPDRAGPITTDRKRSDFDEPATSRLRDR